MIVSDDKGDSVVTVVCGQLGPVSLLEAARVVAEVAAGSPRSLINSG